MPAIAVAGAAPPSAAVTVRVTDCAAALRDSVTGAGQGAVSAALVGEHEKVTVTGPVYQPWRGGFALESVAVMTGSRRAVEADEPVNEPFPAYYVETWRVLPAGTW